MTTTDTTDAVLDRAWAPAYEFAMLDPRTLKLEVNVRDVADLTPEFVATIRQHGVIQPVIAYRHADGGVYVRMGQRRTLGAIEAGCETIPVYILAADPDADDAAATALRIIEQYIENEHRAGFTHSQRTNAFTQLSLLGMSIKDIAAQTGTNRKTAAAMVKVGKSEVAATAQATHGLTLDQALALTEFEDDPQVVAMLTDTAATDPDDFAHQVQRMRDRRAEAKALAEAAAALTEAGVRLVEYADLDNERAERLWHLVDVAEDGTRTEVDEASHASCPGHAAYLSAGWNGIKTVYVCTDWQANGHTDRYPTSTATKPGPMDEAAKAERRRVVENNKAWRSAETVRREWLTTFAARKTTPKDAGVFLAHTLTYRATTIEKASSAGHDLAAKWLGIHQGGITAKAQIADLIDKATPARAQHIALVLALAAIEKATSVQTWRHPGSEAEYLTALSGWGYNLSDVEKIAAGIETDQADDAEPTDETDQAGAATE